LIVSKPRTSTLLSFSLFLLITLVVFFMNAYSIISKQAAWYNYVIAAALIPIGLIVLYRIFIRYKVIRMGNNQVILSFPVLRRRYQYPLQEIVSWKESIVKTGKSSVYKELEVRFADARKLSIGLNEYSEYNRIVQYLNQKAPKKKLTSH
jgi:hypothetical protein